MIIVHKWRADERASARVCGHVGRTYTDTNKTPMALVGHNYNYDMELSCHFATS